MSEVSRVSDDEVRVADDERRAVDERLRDAVGEGLLTLAEYDERAVVVWASRTRGDLAAVTRDLPSPRATAPARRRARRHRRVWCGLAVAGGVLMLLVLPARTEVVSVGTSLSAGIGETTVYVQPGEGVREIGPGVGEVTVVVPDGVRAVLEVEPGVREVDCEEACEVVSDDVVRILVRAGVGDVEVETAEEHD